MIVLIMLCFVLFSASTRKCWLIYDYAIYKIVIVSTGVWHIKFILTTMTMNNKLWLSKCNIVVVFFDKIIHMWIILMVFKLLIGILMQPILNEILWNPARSYHWIHMGCSFAFQCACAIYWATQFENLYNLK